LPAHDEGAIVARRTPAEVRHLHSQVNVDSREGEMIRSVRRSVGERIDHVYYSLLRRTVTRFAPEMVRFDEGDPLLVAGFTGQRHTGWQ
jgi:hypothetical protein